MLPRTKLDRIVTATLTAVILSTLPVGCAAGARRVASPGASPAIVRTRAPSTGRSEVARPATPDRRDSLPDGEREKGPVASEAAPDAARMAGDLASLIRLALERNPEIEAERARFEAAGRERGVATRIPDPRVIYGWYAWPVQTRTGPQEWSLTLQQNVPFPTKIGLRGDVADARAEVAEIRYEAKIRDVVARVATSHHEIGYLRSAVEITERIAEVLDRFEALAAAEREKGTVSLPETFRAESEIAQLSYDRVLLEELRLAEEEGLRSLLRLPPDTSFGRIVPIDPPRFELALDEVVEASERFNQEIRIAEAMRRVREVDRRLARQERYPDLFVGGTYIATGRREDGVDPAGNGDDSLIFQLGVTLPLWWGANDSRDARAEALETAARGDVTAIREELRARVAREYWKAANADRLVRLYRDTLIPQAEAAMVAAETFFEEGKGSFAGLVETVAAWHNFLLAEARARADYGAAIAALEKSVGAPLVLTGEAPR